MNTDTLLDAIGMVDDDLLEPERRKVIPFRGKMAALLAAALIILLSVSAAAAAEGDFEQWGQQITQGVQELVQSAEEAFLKVFRIETPENPPEGTLGPNPTETTGLPGETTESTESTEPAPPTLEYVDMVDIEGAVHAYYFASHGFQYTFEGGVYTHTGRQENGGPPDECAFWEITRDGIVNAGNTRVDFILNHGDKDFRIVFDYALLAGKLCIMVWPEGLNENPYGNGWNAIAIGERTDVVLLSIPVATERDYTHDYFILNLQTLEMTNLLEGIRVEDLILDAIWLTDDLRFALMSGYDITTGKSAKWICDLENQTIVDLKTWTQCDAPTKPYLLDDRTLVVSEYLGEERITVARYDLHTGERTVIVETVSRSGETGYRPIHSHGGGGVHGLLIDENGITWLIDLRTGQRYCLAGLDMSGVYRVESPDGQTILFLYRQRAADEKTSHCYPKIGLLDPENGQMKILTRDISGNAEYWCGFLDANTCVIKSRRDETGGYYLYVYEFTQ